jgi:metal-responsive CopG/Arc/MetJ family transcriptional regulator
MPVRTTIQLDETVLNRARRLVPPRGLSQLINQALRDKVEDLEHRELEAKLREGYIAVREDRDKLAQDWDAIEVEDWPA